jgi:hypothetical protein
MSLDEFELVLRARMKARAAELDRSPRPVPPLRVLLGPPAAGAHRLGAVPLRFALGFALGMVAALALTLALVCGGVLLDGHPQVDPLATVTPSPAPPASPSPSLASPPSSRASPRPSPALPSASLALVPRQTVS